MSKLNISDIEFLTAGSVWSRENGKQSRFLFITNQNLPEKIQRTYPQVVVYADEDGNIMSVPVEDFVTKRTFYNVDPGLEKRIEELLAVDFRTDGDIGFSLDESDEEDQLLVDDTEEQDNDDPFNMLSGDENTPNDVAASDTASMSDSDTPDVTYHDEGTGLPEILSPALLSSCTQGYAQVPLISENKIQHTLIICAAPGVNQTSLYQSFSPSQAEENAIYTFKVHTDEGVLDVDWDTFAGVYPMVRAGSTFYQLIFTTKVPMLQVQAPEVVDAEVVAETINTEVTFAISQPTTVTPTSVPAVNVAPVVQMAPAVSIAPAVTVA